MVGNVGGNSGEKLVPEPTFVLTCLSQREEWREEWGGTGRDSASREMEPIRGRGRPGLEGSGNSLRYKVSQSCSSEM